MNAFRKLMKFFRPGRTSNFSVRRRWAHLELECLDQRLLPSASTNTLSAVTDVTGIATGLYLNPSTGVLFQLRDNVASAIAAPHTVTKFSAGLGPHGFADLFADHNGRIAVNNFDGSGWHDLGQPRPMAAFAAVDGGRAYFQGTDNSLWEYSPEVRPRDLETGLRNIDVDGLPGGSAGPTLASGWRELWGANAVFGLDAITERPRGVNTGRDVVFALGGDGRLEAYTQGGWGGPADQWNVIMAGDGAGHARFSLATGFSAGLDIVGRAEVYWAQAKIEVWRWDQSYGVHGSRSLLADLRNRSDLLDGGLVPNFITYLGGTTDGKFFLKTYLDDGPKPVEEWADHGGVGPAERPGGGHGIGLFSGTEYTDDTGTWDTDMLAVAGPDTFFFHLSRIDTGGSMPNYLDTIYEYSRHSGRGIYSVFNIPDAARLAAAQPFSSGMDTLAAAAFGQFAAQSITVSAPQTQPSLHDNTPMALVSVSAVDRGSVRVYSEQAQSQATTNPPASRARLNTPGTVRPGSHAPGKLVLTKDYTGTAEQ
jgi:hypothetical protein